MTGCLDENAILEWLEGRLPAARIAEYEAHVAGCPSCRALVATLAEAGIVEDDPAAMMVAPTLPNGEPVDSDDLASSAVDDGELLPSLPPEFELLGFLGAGGMGRVFLAEDRQLQRKVALKLIHPRLLSDDGSLQRLLLEARATARLAHPHIVTIYRVGEHAGAPYLALEYLDGQTLRQLLNRASRPLDPEKIAELALAIAEALEHAHGQGVLHRDLKPENIMVPVDGRLRVLDFGLSSLVVDARAQPAHKEAGVHGTPRYMAPERWRGEASGASDVWALGVILDELLTGRTPQGSGEPLLETLCALAMACLEQDPTRRPSAAEVVKRLRGALTPRQERPAATLWSHAQLVVAALVALIGATLTVGGGLFLSEGAEGDGALLAVNITLVVFGLGLLGLSAALTWRGLRCRLSPVFLFVVGGVLALPGTLLPAMALLASVSGEEGRGVALLIAGPFALVGALAGWLLFTGSVRERMRAPEAKACFDSK